MRMTVESLISQQNGTLTGADRKLADVLLALGREAAFLSSHEVSRRAGTHPASAVRFARRLGFAGYPQLQAALREEALVAPENSAVFRMRGHIGSAETGGALAAMVAAEIEGLMQAASQIDRMEIETVAKRLIAARKTVVFGIGHGAILADYLTLRLRRSGYDATSLSALDWQATDTLAGCGAGDEVVLIALRQLNDQHHTLMRHAHKTGLGITLIGDFAASAPRPEQTASLIVARGAAGAQSIIAPSVIINALIVEIGRLDDGRSLRALEAREAVKHSLHGA
jgi:DNA-binding MurR/RpiR family transcriptional regulator